MTPTPQDYQALVGRKFTGKANNISACPVIVNRIDFNPSHPNGPWLAVCFAYIKGIPYQGPRYRKADLFLEPGNYEEILDEPSARSQQA